MPGTINYVEGHASLDGRAVQLRNTNGPQGLPAMRQGDSLSTADGRVEVLLTPGIFLRLGHDSTVRMISPDLTKTEVAVDRGEAELEVDALYKQNDVLIDEGTSQTKVLDHGLYAFNAMPENPAVKVFAGKVAVSPSTDATKWIDVRGGHELALTPAPGKPHGFDKIASEDDLYSWSSLRADYLGQANVSLLQAEYAGAPGIYPGWAWDPYFLGYTWLPYDGFLYSPFGFGFYSPAFFYGGGFGYRGGLAYRGGVAYRGGTAYRGAAEGGFGGHAAFAGGGFHGGGRGR